MFTSTCSSLFIVIRPCLSSPCLPADLHIKQSRDLQLSGALIWLDTWWQCHFCSLIALIWWCAYLAGLSGGQVVYSASGRPLQGHLSRPCNEIFHMCAAKPHGLRSTTNALPVYKLQSNQYFIANSVPISNAGPGVPGKSMLSEPGLPHTTSVWAPPLPFSMD